MTCENIDFAGFMLTLIFTVYMAKRFIWWLGDF